LNIDDNILLVPWINNNNREYIYEELQNSDKKYCMGHFEIIGFEMSGSIPNKEGQKKSLFKNFDNVFSGHFHKRQKRGKIEYLGSPYELNWGDHDGSKRGFHVFDDDTGTIEFIHYPNSLFKVIHWDSKKEPDIDDVNSKFVKLIYNSEIDYKMVSKFVSRLENLGAIQVIPVFNHSINENLNNYEVSGEIKTEDTLSLIKSIIDDEEDIKEKDKNYLNILFESLYKKALENENIV